MSGNAPSQPGGAFVSPGRRLATIDLGTNTVRLLVVEVESPARWRTIEEAQQVTRLGEGLRTTGILAPAAAARTAAVVAEYVGRARERGARDVRIVATSAVREAANGTPFVIELQARTGARVRVVSGEDEARLTLRGVRWGLGASADDAVVFDIGGGSTEYILARAGHLAHAVSLRLGVVPLAERFPFPDRVEAARYAELERDVAARLRAELPPLLGPGAASLLVGTAGTVTTLAALDLGLERYDAGRVQGHRLSRAVVTALLDRLGALPVAARAALPCLEPGRADLIVPGIAIVRATMDHFGEDTLVVSDAGLREGIVADALDG